jgi:membrane protease YdiL (CAAX protease family)
MKYNWFQNANPLVKFLLALSVMFTVGSIIYFSSAIIGAAIFNVSLKEILNLDPGFVSPGYLKLLQYLQVMQSFALFIIPSLLLSVLFSEKPSEFLSTKNKSHIYLYLIGIALIISILPFINYVEDLNSRLKLPVQLKSLEDWMKTSEKNAATITESFLKVNAISALMFNFFMMALLPAVGEEFMFRGIFQRIFSEMFKNVHLGIIISAAFFSAIHFQFYGFIPRMLLGMMFGYLLVWSGSIWIPIAAHFFNNATGVLYYYLQNKGVAGKSLDQVGTATDYPITTVFSVIVTAFLLYGFYKYSARKQQMI